MGAGVAKILSIFTIVVVLFSMQVARAASNLNHPIHDGNLLAADATIMAGILILLTISSIKDEARLSLYSFVGLFPFAFSAAVLIIRGWESDILAGLSRISAIVGLVILATILAGITNPRITKYIQKKKELGKDR